MPVADAARVSDAFFATKRVRALFPVPGVVSVVSQNENGPCPVLALVNALLLTRELDAERLTPDGEGGCGGASMDGIARAVTSVMLERGERAARRDGGVDAETAARTTEDATAEGVRAEGVAPAPATTPVPAGSSSPRSSPAGHWAPWAPSSGRTSGSGRCSSAAATCSSPSWSPTRWGSTGGSPPGSSWTVSR